MCNCLSVVPCGLMEMLRKNLSQNTVKQFSRDAYKKIAPEPLGLIISVRILEEKLLLN